MTQKELMMRRYMMTQDIFPYDAEVEYVESTGSQYIDTGINLHGRDIVTVRAQCMSHTQNATNRYTMRNPIFGTQLALDNKYWVQFVDETTFFYYNTYEREFYTRVVDFVNDYKMHTFVFNQQYVYIDGKKYAMNLTPERMDSPDTLGNAFLFASHHYEDPPHAYFGVVKIERFKIQREGTTICDMIPVRKGKEGCMYDIVRKQLFRSVTARYLVPGPDIAE